MGYEMRLCKMKWSGRAVSGHSSEVMLSDSFANATSIIDSSPRGYYI
jgi:hypothetical protein